MISVKIWLNSGNNHIIVHAASVIDAITVGNLKIGGRYGHRFEIVLSPSEKIYAIQFEHPGSTYFPTGSMCALVIFTIDISTNMKKHYGAYSNGRNDCEGQRFYKIPKDMSFRSFFEANAKKISKNGVETITFDL